MHFLSCAGELNHHGRFMCDSLYSILGDDFRRITTQQVNEERLNLGYKQNAVTSYNIVQINANQKTIEETISWCDVIDFGAAPEAYLSEAVKQNKIIFIRIERLFKEGYWKILVPEVFFRYYKKYIKYRNNTNVYYLCVSGYAAKDLAKIGIKGNRVLQWAYCPEFIPMGNEDFERNCEPIQILWCGRMIGWKHPEMAIKIAVYLKEIGCSFNMKILGTGDMFDQIKDMVLENGLRNNVEMLGAIDSSTVRKYMKNADIFLATSDRNEGWGVVVNEAMNSGCAVFASPEMGAVPVLIKDEKNGFYIYRGKEKEAAKKIFDLSCDAKHLIDVKKAAYNTIKNHFSPDIYAQKFIELAYGALGDGIPEMKCLGSKAEIR